MARTIVEVTSAIFLFIMSSKFLTIEKKKRIYSCLFYYYYFIFFLPWFNEQSLTGLDKQLIQHPSRQCMLQQTFCLLSRIWHLQKFDNLVGICWNPETAETTVVSATGISRMENFWIHRACVSPVSDLAYS